MTQSSADVHTERRGADTNVYGLQGQGSHAAGETGLCDCAWPRQVAACSGFHTGGNPGMEVFYCFVCCMVYGSNMKIRSTAKVLAKCKLKFDRISEWAGRLSPA